MFNRVYFYGEDDKNNVFLNFFFFKEIFFDFFFLYFKNLNIFFIIWNGNKIFYIFFDFFLEKN